MTLTQLKQQWTDDICSFAGFVRCFLGHSFPVRGFAWIVGGIFGTLFFLGVLSVLYGWTALDHLIAVWLPWLLIVVVSTATLPLWGTVAVYFYWLKKRTAQELSRTC